MTKSALFLPLLSIFALFTFAGCDDDEDQGSNRPPLTYDAGEHIYGTFGYDREAVWEVVIDPVSGRFDSIPGTNFFQALSYPLGPRYFQKFNPDRRYFVSIDDDFVVQDLSTLQYETFTSDSGNSLTNPQFITRGSSDDELIIMDSDQSLWRADLDELTLNRAIDHLDPQNQVNTIAYVYQVGENQILRLLNDENCANCATVHSVDVVDLEQEEILASASIGGDPFGFVKHPDRNEFYFLSRASNGFRLASMTWDGSAFGLNTISTENLAMESLSGQQQTIHTATNTFIAVGPRGDIEDPASVLYRIDLTTGELLGETALETGGLLFKIAGE